MMTRVLVADDHPAFLLGVRIGLAAHGFDVVTALNGPEAVEVARRVAPDAALLDVRMPGDGIATCAELTRSGVVDAVLILTTFDDPATRQRAAAAGARAYLTKDAPLEDLARTIKRLIGDPQLVLLRTPDLPDLTPRELDVLRLLGEGLSNKDVARALGVGVETVKDHCSNLFAKLDVADRARAVIVGRQLGLLVDLPQ